MTIQVPPAVGSSGQFLESVVVTSSQNRQIIGVGDATTTAYAPVTSSGGVSVNVTNPSTAVNVANTVTVTATQATNPWSSAPSFNVPIVSASSGFFQISGTPFVNVVGTSSGVAPVTTSGGVLVTALQSGTYTVVSASSGAVQTLSSGAVLLSSAGITQAIITGTSGGFGLVTSAGSLQVITTASASGSTAVNIVGTSNGIAPVTTSGGLGVTILAGSASGSTAINIVGSSNATAPATSSGGLSVTFVNTAGPVTTSAGAYVNLVTTGGISFPGSTTVGLRVSQGASVLAGTSTGPWIIDERIQIYSSVPQYAEVSATSSGHVTIVSAVTSMSIYVLGYALIADSSNTIIWESSNTDISGSMLFSTAGTGLVCPVVSPGAGAWLKTSVSGDLGLLVGNAGTVAGHLTYYTATS